MNLSTVEVLQKAAELGLRLGREAPDTLTVQPVARCPPDFAETLRVYKRRLLSLLQLPFVMVFSQILGETIFFCEDETTKAALVKAGAEPWSIYAKDELRVLVAQNRVAPLSPAELRKVYEIKRTFSGRITR
jgi:hypothetical protein